MQEEPPEIEMNPTEFETIEEVDGKAVIGELEDPGTDSEPSTDTVETTIVVEDYFESYEAMERAGLLFIKHEEPRKGVWIGLHHPEDHLDALTAYLQEKADEGKIPYNRVHIYYAPFTQKDLADRTRLVADEVSRIASKYEGTGFEVSTDFHTGEPIVTHNFLNEDDKAELQVAFPQYKINFENGGTQVPEKESDRVLEPDSPVTDNPELSGQYIFEVEEDAFSTAEAGAIAGEQFDATDWSFKGAAEQLKVGQRVEVDGTGFSLTSYPEQSGAVIVKILPSYQPQDADKTEEQIVQELVQMNSFRKPNIKTISELTYVQAADKWTASVINSENDQV
ncbi:hypothetical protein KP77_27960 [Jeotgalibacillus alimentarius]|uniref:Uncharacterized protein n=1 Tax=Jeotgalibacillus alimentarius TaxID=135826 RepID=A0A0C2RY11_9BACL|nr:hypothetical protein [Jeotgalibacillus alimentarius]KIL46669.1 hypothetical protein KP77_27960 [Jeotgalibacillus alimentarius]